MLTGQKVVWQTEMNNGALSYMIKLVRNKSWFSLEFSLKDVYDSCCKSVQVFDLMTAYDAKNLRDTFDTIYTIISQSEGENNS